MKTILILAMAMFVSACGHPNSDPAPSPAPVPPAAANPTPTYATSICGETVLTVGALAFIVDFQTGATQPMVENQIYTGTWSCQFFEVAGVPEEK